MKKLFLFTVLIASAILSSYAQGNAQDYNKLINLKRYEKDNAELPPPAENEQRVVFIGNSITEGWVRLRPEFFTSNNYIGRGISGQTSPQLLSRFRQDVINLKPVAVVINIGTNDIAENTGEYDADFTLGNIRSMVELAKANGITAILSSVTPAAKYAWRPNIQNVVEKIARLNETIKAYSKESGVVYIDYFSDLADENNALKPDYGSDGVHPNAKAYEIMEQKAKAAIAKTLTPTRR